jgi:hypothetical protein
MPLAGIVDPSHDVSKVDWRGDKLPPWLTPEELVAHSKLQGPKWSEWNYELLHAMVSDQQQRDYLSTTALLGCERTTVIERKEPYIMLSATEMYASFRGTMVHLTLEHSARPNSLAECRFHTTINGIAVSCSPDLITEDGQLWDYKTPSEGSGVPPYEYPWPSHTLQLMFNAYIVRHAEKVEGLYVVGNGLTRPATLDDIPPITSVTVQYLGPKNPKPITFEKKQPSIIQKGPNAGQPGQPRKQPYVWTDDEVESGLKINTRQEPGLPARLEAMAAALEAYPEVPLEALEIWGGPDEYRCPGAPYCKLPNCLAKRYPHALYWERD